MFTAAFEKVTLTLIAKLAEINESLSRISSDTELLAKIKIQLAENMKQSSAVEKHINVLNSRLDKMGIGGLSMAAMGTPEPSPMNMPKPATSNASGEDSLFSMPATPSTAEKEGALKDNLADLGLPPVDSLFPKQAKGKIDPPISVKPSPLTPLPNMPKPKGTKAPAQLPTPEPAAKLSPLPNKPAPRAVSNLPYLQIKSPENTSFVIIQNLSKEVNELDSSEEIGKAFLRAKDLLTAQIKFHPALFDLIKYGNDYIRKKPAVNDDFRVEVQKKVEELYHKFGGT